MAPTKRAREILAEHPKATAWACSVSGAAAGPVYLQAVARQTARNVGTLGHDIDAEDATVATVAFTSGALGLISTSTATPPASDATETIHTNRGIIELGHGEVLRWDIGAPHPGAAPG